MTKRNLQEHLVYSAKLGDAISRHFAVISKRGKRNKNWTLRLRSENVDLPCFPQTFFRSSRPIIFYIFFCFHFSCHGLYSACIWHCKKSPLGHLFVLYFCLPYSLLTPRTRGEELGNEVDD